MNELQQREATFKEFVFAFTQYENMMLQQFFDYWSEANRSGRKMRFEMEKTWDLKKRLNRWQLNNINWKNGNSKKGTSEARLDALRTWGTNPAQ